jgi:HD-GYP domain-containing protein (c-di-GMP phosphodiesterase class II)
LLKIGYEMEPASNKRLHEMGVRSIWVRYPALDCLDQFVNSEVVQAQSEVISEMADTFQQVQSKAVARLNYDAYTGSIGKMITALVQNPQAAIFLDDMSGGDGADMVRHSSTVAYMSLLIGLKLEGYLVKQRKHVDPSRAKEVISLGVGAMLHDVGILHLSNEARELWKQTGDDSDPEFREHPSLGYRIVRGHVETTAATVLLNHHQRVDG